MDASPGIGRELSQLKLTKFAPSWLRNFPRALMKSTGSARSPEIQHQ
jgi:hypothetical protein